MKFPSSEMEQDLGDGLDRYYPLKWRSSVGWRCSKTAVYRSTIDISCQLFCESEKYYFVDIRKLVIIYLLFHDVFHLSDFR